MQFSALFPYRLYLVISEADCRGRDFVWVAEQAILGGVEILQLREKELETKAFLRNATRLKAVTDRYGVPLVINDNLDVAMRLRAAGIHVGRNDVRPQAVRKIWEGAGLVGYSIEQLEQLDSRETEAADYLGISPVFSTPTKRDTLTEWGIEGIRKIRQQTGKPLVAIGRMNRDNVVEVMQAGANCVAVVSAICSADSPYEAARELTELINNTI